MTARPDADPRAEAARIREIAESYYDSSDADAFYMNIWGGEDIHVGLYATPDESIFDASRRTVETMAGMLGGLSERTRVLDLGAGYGGSARFLTAAFGCPVACLNVSEIQNDNNRRLNKEHGLESKIEVVHGTFEDVPVEDASVDVVWSQDAFLHSGDREKVFDEIDRVLKPGGRLIFTDPMQADDCPPGVLQPVYDRIHLDSLGSVAFYREQAKARGWSETGVEVMTEQLRNHYDRVRRELVSRYEEMCAVSSKDYCDRMLTGLQNWVSAADSGYLAWGILMFEKPTGRQ
jgi:sarcosine/dimethylglycine N-methyltransferase